MWLKCCRVKPPIKVKRKKPRIVCIINCYIDYGNWTSVLSTHLCGEIMHPLTDLKSSFNALAKYNSAFHFVHIKKIKTFTNFVKLWFTRYQTTEGNGEQETWPNGNSNPAIITSGLYSKFFWETDWGVV